MKTIKLLLLSLIVLSCSKDDDSPSNTSGDNLFNPPEWIHGTWKNEINSNSYISYKFSDSNVVQTTVLSNNNSTVDYKMVYSNDFTIVTEDTTVTSYSYTIAIDSSEITSETTIQFKKVSETQIQPYIAGQGGLLFNKQP